MEEESTVAVKATQRSIKKKIYYFLKLNKTQQQQKTTLMELKRRLQPS